MKIKREALVEFVTCMIIGMIPFLSMAFIKGYLEFHTFVNFLIFDLFLLFIHFVVNVDFKKEGEEDE